MHFVLGEKRERKESWGWEKAKFFVEDLPIYCFQVIKKKKKGLVLKNQEIQR